MISKNQAYAILIVSMLALVGTSSYIASVENKNTSASSSVQVNEYSYNKIRSISKASGHRICVKTSVPADLASYWGGYRIVSKITIKYYSVIYGPGITSSLKTKTISYPTYTVSKYKYGPWLNRRSYLKYYITLPSDVYQLKYVSMTVRHRYGGDMTMSASCNIIF